MYFYFRLKIIVWALLCASCGSQPAVDLGDMSSLSPLSPRIVDVEYQGQSPAAKFVLIFQVTFEDKTGSLDDGYIEILSNQSRDGVSQLPLRPFLLQSEVAPGAKRGTIQVPMNVSFRNASKFEISLQLRDSLDRKSNVAKVRLQADKL